MLETFAFNPRTVFVYEFANQSACTCYDYKEKCIETNAIQTSMGTTKTTDVWDCRIHQQEQHVEMEQIEHHRIATDVLQNPIPFDEACHPEEDTCAADCPWIRQQESFQGWGRDIVDEYVQSILT